MHYVGDVLWGLSQSDPSSVNTSKAGELFDASLRLLSDGKDLVKTSCAPIVHPPIFTKEKTRPKYALRARFELNLVPETRLELVLPWLGN